MIKRRAATAGGSRPRRAATRSGRQGSRRISRTGTPSSTLNTPAGPGRDVTHPCPNSAASSLGSSSADLPGEPRGRGAETPRHEELDPGSLAGRKARQLLDWIDVGTLSRGSGTGRSLAERLLTTVNPPPRERGEPRRMRNLSERQRQVLDFIRGYVRDNGVAPSRPERSRARSRRCST